jgi:phage terminase large subunit-like protein
MGICGEKHLYAESLINKPGSSTDWSFLPVIFAAGQDDNWKDEATWAKANPSYGITIHKEEMQEAVNQALSPAAEANFRRYRLNQWGFAEAPWVPMEAWNACKVPFDEEELFGRECWGGLDLSSTTDITAWAMVFPDDDDERFTILVRLFVPELRVQEMVERQAARYDQWVRDGFLIAIPGETIDEQVILDHIFEDAEKFNLQNIRFDRWGSRNIARQLDDANLSVVPFGQGYKAMTNPVKEFHKLTIEHRLRHFNDCLDWMASNVTVEEDPAGNIKMTKRSKVTGQRRKIDGIIATVMGLDGAIFGEDDDMPIISESSISFL